MQKAASFIFLIFIVLSSCKDSRNGFEEGYENAQNDANEEERSEIENVPELFVFDGGRILENTPNRSSSDEITENEPHTLADAFYVVKHPKGVLIWDTGLPEHAIGEESFITQDGAFTISRKDSVSKQLASIGLSTEDVDYIGFSHIHFDHTGSANHFPNAKWLVQKSTLDFIESDSIKDNKLYDLDTFNKLTNKKVLSGDYDLFEDGKVIIKYLSGTAAGNQGLFVNLKENGPILIAGHTYHFKNLDGGVEELNKSMGIVEEFVKMKNAKVYIQHDIEDFKAMQKAPESLK